MNPDPNSIRIRAVDDHPLFRQGIAALLATTRCLAPSVDPIGRPGCLAASLPALQRPPATKLQRRRFPDREESFRTETAREHAIVGPVLEGTAGKASYNSSLKGTVRPSPASVFARPTARKRPEKLICPHVSVLISESLRAVLRASMQA